VRKISYCGEPYWADLLMSKVRQIMLFDETNILTSQDILDAVNKSPCLTQLSVQYTANFGQEVVCNIKDKIYQCLIALKIQFTQQLSNKSIIHLSTFCKSLVCLCLRNPRGGSHIDEQCLMNLIASNKNLATLTLQLNTDIIGNSTLETISSNCHQLSVCHLYHVRNVSLRSIVGLMISARGLTYLMVSMGCEGCVVYRKDSSSNFREARLNLLLSGFYYDDWTEFFTQLSDNFSFHRICVAHNENLNEKILKVIVSRNLQLIALSIKDCGELYSKSSLVNLIDKCKHLVSLQLTWCTHLTHDDLKSIFLTPNCLTNVCLVNNELCSHTFAEILDSCPNIEEFSFNDHQYELPFEEVTMLICHLTLKERIVRFVTADDFFSSEFDNNEI
jgi:hypothetical protein